MSHTTFACLWGGGHCLISAEINCLSDSFTQEERKAYALRSFVMPIKFFHWRNLKGLKMLSISYAPAMPCLWYWNIYTEKYEDSNESWNISNCHCLNAWLYSGRPKFIQLFNPKATWDAIDIKLRHIQLHVSSSSCTNNEGSRFEKNRSSRSIKAQDCRFSAQDQSKLKIADFHWIFEFFSSSNLDFELPENPENLV